MTPAEAAFRPITIEEYFGPYWKHPEVTDEVKARAQSYLDIANPMLEAAMADGVKLHVNAHTACYLAGDGNGGWRPSDCPIGAPGSAHKRAAAGDWFDPERELCRWSLRNQWNLKAAGIMAMENPQYTPTWAHWQDVLLPSGHFVFIPSRDAKILAEALPEQKHA